MACYSEWMLVFNTLKLSQLVTTVNKLTYKVLNSGQKNTIILSKKSSYQVGDRDDEVK